MGPLSAKQHREYLKFDAQERRETAKMEREESRKQELHEVKLMEAAAKAGQSVGHKEELHHYKMGTLGAPLGKSKVKTPNPLAGTEMFHQGQHMLPFQVTDAAKARKQNTDTVSAMLTPGEAVIPEPAAQDPKNKPLIKKMVQQGRQANKAKKGFLGLRDGSVNIVYSDAIPSRVQQAAGYADGTPAVPQLMNYADGTEMVEKAIDMYSKYNEAKPGYADGTSGVPSLAYRHPDVPGSSFEEGTERVYDFSRGSADRQYYEDGITEVPNVDANKAQQLAYEEEMRRAAANAGSLSAEQIQQSEEEAAIEQQRRLGNLPIPTTNSVSSIAIKDGTKIAALEAAVPANSAPESLKPVPVAAPVQAAPAIVPVAKTVAPLYGNQWVKGNEADPKAGTASKNPNSSAYGLYQMTDAAWTDAEKVNPVLKGVNRSNAANQELAREAYVESVRRQLTDLKIEPSEAAIAKSWVVGAKGYSRILKGDPNAPLSLDPKVIAINPNLQNKTNKQFLDDPDPYSRRPSGREIAIANQDLATSSNPKVRKAAEDTLKRAQLTPPTRADNFQQSQVTVPVPVAEVVPKPSREASGKLIDTRERDEFGNLLVPVPRTIAEDNPPVIIPKDMKDLESTSPGSTKTTVAEDNPPVVIPDDMKDLKDPIALKERDSILAQFTKDMEDTIKNQVEVIDRKPDWVNPDDKKDALAKFIESIYGEKGIFSAKELTRFAVVAAGGLLTGGSVNGSFKYAARDALQYADSRHSAEAAHATKMVDEERAFQRQKDLKLIETSNTNIKERQKETRVYFNKEIDEYEKVGRLTPENAALLRKAVYSGNYSVVEKALDSGDQYGTDLYKAGIPHGTKPVTIVEEGYTKGRTAFKDESGNYIVFDTDNKGNKIPRIISNKNQREVSDTSNVATQNESRLKDLLGSRYFTADKKTGKTPFDLSSGEAISQLNIWQQEQNRLGLPDDYTRFSDQINDGLDRALRSGERRPNITKILHLATIHTSTLTDEVKMTSTVTGKIIPTSKIGEMVQDIREHNSPKEKYKNSVDEYKAQSNQSTKFLDKVSTEYEQMKREEGFTPNALAEKARSKKIDDKLINKIREAPNPYWALVYYRMAVPRQD